MMLLALFFIYSVSGFTQIFGQEAASQDSDFIFVLSRRREILQDQLIFLEEIKPESALKKEVEAKIRLIDDILKVQSDPIGYFKNKRDELESRKAELQKLVSLNAQSIDVRRVESELKAMDHQIGRMSGFLPFTLPNLRMRGAPVLAVTGLETTKFEGDPKTRDQLVINVSNDSLTEAYDRARYVIRKLGINLEGRTISEVTCIKPEGSEKMYSADENCLVTVESQSHELLKDETNTKMEDVIKTRTRPARYLGRIREWAGTATYRGQDEHFYVTYDEYDSEVVGYERKYAGTAWVGGWWRPQQEFYYKNVPIYASTTTEYYSVSEPKTTTISVPSGEFADPMVFGSISISENSSELRSASKTEIEIILGRLKEVGAKAASCSRAGTYPGGR